MEQTIGFVPDTGSRGPDLRLLAVRATLTRDTRIRAFYNGTRASRRGLRFCPRAFFGRKPCLTRSTPLTNRRQYSLASRHPPPLLPLLVYSAAPLLITYSSITDGRPNQSKLIIPHFLAPRSPIIETLAYLSILLHGPNSIAQICLYHFYSMSS